jgi:hypothetical protein
MTNATFVPPGRLSDEELLARVHRLARHEHAATAALVAHLAELDERRLHVAQGYSSLFVYCTKALHFSEDAAYARIKAARAGRRFPVIFEMLSSGELHLTGIRLLAPHLTRDNHRALLARARHRGKREIEKLVAEICPKPDVRAMVRKLPVRAAASQAVAAPPSPFESAGSLLEANLDAPGDGTVNPDAGQTPTPPTTPTVIVPLAPNRYKIQFTAGQAMYDRLQQVRELLRHRIPDGDPGAVLDEALILLLEKLEKQKLARTDRPRVRKAAGSAQAGPQGQGGEESIGALEPSGASGEPGNRSRHIPAEVRREVWKRDDGQCGFRSPGGRRCGERGFLEFHHFEPFAVGGKSTTDNIGLRCRAHNQQEGEHSLGRQTMGRWLDDRDERSAGGSPRSPAG